MDVTEEVTGFDLIVFYDHFIGEEKGRENNLQLYQWPWTIVLHSSKDEDRLHWTWFGGSISKGIWWEDRRPQSLYCYSY